MPTKKRPKTLVVVEEEERDRGGDIYAFLDELGEEVETVDIFRMNRDGGRPHVERVTLDIIKENVYEHLRQPPCNGGKFLLQFKNGLREIVKSKVIEVENLKPAEKPNTDAGDGLSTFMREQLTLQQNMILALIAGMKPPDFSWMAALMKPSDPAAMLAALVGGFNAMKPNGDGADSIGRLREAMGLIKEFTSDDKEETVLGVVKEVGGKFVQALTGGGQMLLPATTATAAAEVPAAQPAAQPNPPAESDAQMILYLKAGLTYLKGRCKAGKEPEFLAETIIENRDEPQNRVLLHAIEQGATFENLLQFDPEIASNPVYEKWFRELFVQLNAHLKKSVDTAGASGNGANPAGDERIRPRSKPGSGHGKRSKPRRRPGAPVSD